MSEGELPLAKFARFKRAPELWYDEMRDAGLNAAEIKILENKEIVTRKLAVKALVETMQKHFSVQNASKNIN